MPKKKKYAAGKRQRRRNISVRAIRREHPDIRTLSRAVVAMALAREEAAAQAHAEAETTAGDIDPDASHDGEAGHE